MTNLQGDKADSFFQYKIFISSSCQPVNLLPYFLNTSVKIEKKEKKDRDANK